MPNRPLISRTACAIACTGLLFFALACDIGNPSPTSLAPLPPATLTAAPTGTSAPTQTKSPPTAPVPTDTSAPPVATAPVPTDTSAPPAATVPAPTDTSAPPIATVSLPTNTAAPPTDTAIAHPTAAPAAPTARPALPTRTHAPQMPATRVPTEPPAPTRVPTEPPAATSVQTEPPAATPDAEATGAPVPGRIAGDLSQIVRVPPGKKRIALTFDAGSTRGHIPEILAALARHNAHITFFVTGQWAEQNPEQLRAIVAAGDEVANHTYSHPSFPKLTDQQMIAELDKCEAIISSITGLSTKPYWRPPFGDENGHVLDVTSAHGYRSIFWTLDSLDSIGKPKTKDFILNRVTNASINLDGAIILQHVASDPSSEALPEILDQLYARGLAVVTITGLLSP
ncbi:MAG: polysaccharide deacetylase family protein [Chloroflexia bacterium]